jgi:FkbM family methyltransferase
MMNVAAKLARTVVLPATPRRLRLPARYWLHHLEGSCEDELRYLPRLGCRGQVAIDVGANEGLYSYRLSKLFSKVYAFEINDELTGELAAYNPGNIEIIHVGLSSRQGSALLYVPVVNGLALTGWASLAPGNCPDTREHLEKTVTLCPLDTYKLRDVSFIKIDVEGHEPEVLKGASQTLATNRPLVLLEVKRRNMDEVCSFFAGLGYRKRKLQDLVGREGSEENSFFVPEEWPTGAGTAK